MSGVVLVVSFEGRPVSEEDLDPIVTAAAYRGPHGREVEFLAEDGGAAVLAVAATPGPVPRPLSSSDGVCLLAADCRLDNRRELAAELALDADGSEVGDEALVLAAYRRWGTGCPDRLRGDFAVALWDRSRQRCLLARDPLGVRTLHYARWRDVLVVASEAQQIVRFAGIRRDLDERKVGEWLTVGFDDDGRTFYRDVTSVRPGEAVVVRRDGETSTAYWDPAAVAEVRYRRPEAYGEHFRSLFEASVRARTRASGETVGIQLSGGLDSASIAACAQALASGQGEPALVGLSAVFDEDDGCDERSFIDDLAAHWGLETCFFPAADHPLVDRRGDEATRIDRETPLNGWPALERAMGTVLRSRGSRVLLTGHGGDAIVYGSPLVYADLAREARFVRLAGDIARHAWTRRCSPVRLGYLYVVRQLLPHGLIERLRQLKRRRGGALVPPWIRRDFAASSGLEAAVRARAAPHTEGRTARGNILHGTLHLGDVAATVHWLERELAPFGIDVRHPFLDRALAEFALAVPPEELYRAGVGKRLLRASMCGLLPESIRTRKDKAVFLGFVGRWLRREGGELVEMLATGRLVGMGLVDEGGLRAALDAWRAGTAGHLTGPLLRLIQSERWVRGVG